MTDEAKQGVFGIDLGTTYSAVAYIDNAGKPVIARNNSGEETTPSVIYFESADNVVVGTTAKDTAVVTPDSVVSLVKREMGSADYVRTFFGSEYSAPALSALILDALRGGAESDSGRRLERAVITVPAYFGMIEKSATRQAGELAGIEVIGLVPEPVAAALAYGFGTDAESKTLLVYDLGGGTFDVTVIRLGTDEIRALVVDGNAELGGADWDEILIEHIAAEITTQLGDDSIRDDEAAMQEIATKAEKAKRELSSKESAKVIMRHSGGSATVTVTRAEFEEMTKHLLGQTIDITKRALETLEASDPGTTLQITDVLLVGGSSFMPAVAHTLKSEFGWDSKLADPNLAVARGAALYAAGHWPDTDSGDTSGTGTTSDQTDEERAVALKAAAEAAAEKTGVPEETFTDRARQTIIGALPKAIGVKVVDTTVAGWDDNSKPEPPFAVEHLVPAQSEIPFKQPVSFRAYTASANAPKILVEIWEQAGAVAGRQVHENRFLERGFIEGLAPLNLPAESPIDLLFTVDGDGVALVKAVEPTSGQSVEVKARIQLLDDEGMEKARTSLKAVKNTTT
jgi:molecular chaperone DnaK